MAKKSDPDSSPAETPSPESLGLDGFRDTADDLGLSLDELGQAYASLLDGADPYVPAPHAPESVPESAEDELVLAGLFAAEQRLAAARAEARDDDQDDDAPADPLATAVTEARRASGALGPSQPSPPHAFASSTSVRAVSRTAARSPGLDAGGPASWTSRDRCEISPRTILESMLFVGHPANAPLTAKQVASLMRGVLPREIDELVQELNDTYSSEGAPYRIDSDGAGYRLTLTSEFAPLRDKFLGRVREVRLNPAVVDVLAIVAYNQPIAREEIDRLRNKSSGAILSQLVRRGLLRLDLSDERQRQSTYYTTDRFLELFRLRSLDDLPRSQEIERNFG